MSVPEELAYEQWRTYLPFLYKFYFEHKDLKLVETIGAKLYKDLTDPKTHTLSFIIAGLQSVEHNNQGYKYSITERVIKAYNLNLDVFATQDQQTRMNIERKQPQIVETNRIYYEKDITCLQDIILLSKRAIEYETSRAFYVVALKNQSIRILNADSLVGRKPPKRLSFLSERSPFLTKNANYANLCSGNPYEVGVIPLQRQVLVTKYNPHDMILLCGCSDGTIVSINLNFNILSASDRLTNAFTVYEYHKRPVRDLVWMIYSYDEKNSFASVADDGKFCVWNKEQSAFPISIVEQSSILPTSLIEVYPDQFVVSGRDCTLKFFDIRKGTCYLYNQNSEIITKLFNLTGQIQFALSNKQSKFDQSLRFVSCEQSGKIVFWQGDKEFEHLTHKSRIASIDFANGFYLAIQKQTPRLSIFSPVLYTHCLQDPSL